MAPPRGRVLKATDVRLVAEAPGTGAPPATGGPQTHVEVVREAGCLRLVRVRCECGRAHEIEFAPDPDSLPEKET